MGKVILILCTITIISCDKPTEPSSKLHHGTWILNRSIEKENDTPKKTFTFPAGFVKTDCRN